MRIACWIPKGTNTHLCCVILIAFPLQQWLHERLSMLRYNSFACIFAYLTATCRPFLRPTQPSMQWIIGLKLPERDSGQWPSLNNQNLRMPGGTRTLVPTSLQVAVHIYVKLEGTRYNICKLLPACSLVKAAAAAGRVVLCQTVMTDGHGALVDGSWKGSGINWLVSTGIIIITIMIFLIYTLQPFKAYCAIWVRRSNVRHQASPRVSPRESTQRRKVVGQK
jgi:hypothetical protein